MRFNLAAWVFAATLFIPPVAAVANVLCVTAPKANLRSGPGTNFKVTWTVGKYMPLKQIGAQGQWLKVVDLDGEEHWVASSMVSKNLQCVVVKSKFANLRKKPAPTAEPADIPIADRYTPFKKIEREDSWLLVEDDYKQRFWVSDTTMWWPVNRSKVSF